MILPVDDPDDPRIAEFVSVRERDLVGRRGRYIAEGEVVLRLAASRPDHRLRALLLSERGARGLADLLPGLDAPVYVARQAVMDAIVGFPIHRGMLGLVEPPPAPDPAALLAGLAPEARVVGLLGITNHDNVGGIFRNAAAFGAAAILLDAACCDPLYRKAIRVSVGASLIVPFARVADGADMLRRLDAAGFSVRALSPSGAMRLSDYRPAGRTAVLFGTEGPGLPADLLAATPTLSIPMAPGFDSLNVATTSGIVLHHLAAR
ncbi:TrmH family RNA methyltransferase [Aquabacter spiritensis]|uniref:tRNA G18 (Ribose-2'-O)-methylase SpoU n=1 Tax=Aquabacter spiritensis TaxID=933073 RepID=A0A4R3LX46_9HYPH|nr:RNA methyltransferase [Aquabacter spiritensis]TCT05210.1 tRNA G18 (ribose-2'-O)-methylase SpoU [Aquabacter spiritensis]